MGSIRLVAFFLPQFHPIPENDEWWGRGFTEWTNVTKALPIFRGHYQPHLPTELGFYDLRLRQSRHDQIAMAQQYGVDAFCYHYYWFSGTRLLHQPLDDMLSDPDSDMPFCLCWANENWTRRWDAAEHQILIAQKYRPDDDLEFIKSVIPFFKDPRYVRVDGAPVLIVYRPQHLPDSRRAAALWREYCASVGIPKLHLACALTHGNLDYERYGFDAGVEFPPHQMPTVRYENELDLYCDFRGIVLDYTDMAKLYLDMRYKEPNVYRCVFPSWDNTARVRSRAGIVLNGTPGNYEMWLSEAVRRTSFDFPGQDRLVFINAWNEWAEGCHLEPDRKYGRGFLEATLRVKQGRSVLTAFPDVGLPRLVRAAMTPEEWHLFAVLPRPRRRSLARRLALRGRRAAGHLLRPFPGLRQRAVKVFVAMFEREPPLWRALALRVCKAAAQLLRPFPRLRVRAVKAYVALLGDPA